MMNKTTVRIVVVPELKIVVSSITSKNSTPTGCAHFISQPNICGVLAVVIHPHRPVIEDGDFLICRAIKPDSRTSFTGKTSGVTLNLTN